MFKTMFSSKCSQKKFNFQTFNRFYCNSVRISDQTTELKPTRKEKHIDEIFSYLKLNNAEHLLSEIPSMYFVRSKQPKKYLLINPNVAKQIGRMLISHIKDENILEYDPGFGLLTEKLVHQTSQLKLYEEDQRFIPNLLEFEKKYGDKLRVLNKKLFGFDEVLHSAVQSCSRIKEKKTLVVVVHLKNSLSQWLPLLMKNTHLQLKQFKFFFLIHPNTYEKLIASPCTGGQKYQSLSVLSQLAFDSLLLCKNIPRNAFLPWSVGKKDSTEDNENVYLIKITAKKSFFKQFKNEDQICYFVDFMKYVMFSRKRIIPYFETIIPNCGPKLILMGYTIYTKSNDLKPKELLELFLEFSKFPEFNSIAFFTHLQNQNKNLNSNIMTEIPHSIVSPQNHHGFNPLFEYEDHDDEDNEVDDSCLPKSWPRSDAT